jgi:hypothetical protein
VAVSSLVGRPRCIKDGLTSWFESSDQLGFSCSLYCGNRSDSTGLVVILKILRRRSLVSNDISLCTRSDPWFPEEFDIRESSYQR